LRWEVFSGGPDPAQRIRGHDEVRCLVDALQLPDAAGFFEPEPTELEDGDVLVFAPGPAQLHLAIVAPGGGIIHAHAGLRRVVRTPFPLPWPIIGHWRLS